jgi:tRNA(Ile)-lysidine synthetase-like protein
VTVELLESLEANVVLQGHHADDQTETMLLKLLRGCHISRIAGMRPREGVFGRPLLSFPKRDLVGFLESRAETWREDPSNATPKYLRNRVRAELIPLLRELADEGGVEYRVEALTAQSADLREWLDEVPSAFLAHGEAPLSSSSPFDRSYLERGEIDLDAWSRLPKLAREDQVRAYVSDCAGVDMEYNVLRKLCKQLFARANADANVADPPEWEWRIRGNWVLQSFGTRAWAAKSPRLDLAAKMTRQTEDTNGEACDAEATAKGNEVVIDAGCGVSITHPPGWSIRTSWETSVSKGDTTEGVRLANLPDMCALRLRFRQPGDAFRPGHSRRLKLKDWMRGNGVPLHARDRTPLVCLDDDILAVYPFVSTDALPSAGASVKDVRNGARLNLVVDHISVDVSATTKENA